MLDFQFDFRYEGEEIPALKNAALFSAAAAAAESRACFAASIISCRSSMKASWKAFVT